jgi:hypothetical protein
LESLTVENKPNSAKRSRQPAQLFATRAGAMHEGASFMEEKLLNVNLEKIGDTGVARIIFNRPNKRNAKGLSRGRMG